MLPCFTPGAWSWSQWGVRGEQHHALPQPGLSQHVTSLRTKQKNELIKLVKVSYMYLYVFMILFLFIYFQLYSFWSRFSAFFQHRHLLAPTHEYNSDRFGNPWGASSSSVTRPQQFGGLEWRVLTFQSSSGLLLTLFSSATTTPPGCT